MPKFLQTVRISKLHLNKMHCSQIMENLFSYYQKWKIQIMETTNIYIYKSDVIAFQISQFFTNLLWVSLKNATWKKIQRKKERKKIHREKLNVYAVLGFMT